MNSARIMYFHIGQFKTGTTSIQKFLKKNSAPLNQQNLYYPGEFLEFGRLSLPLFKNFYRKTNPLADTNIAHALNKIHGTKGNLIYSCEFLGAFTEHLDELRDTFKGFTHKVVLFIRKIDDYFESLYNQLVRTYMVTDEVSLDKFIDFFCQIEANRHYLINCWAKAFGKENIKIFLYDSQKDHHYLYEQFSSAINLKINTDFLTLEHKFNASMPIKILLFMKEINRLYQKDYIIARNIKWEIAEAFRKGLLNDFKSEHRLLSSKQRKKIVSYALIYENKIAKEYFNLDQLFNYDFSENLPSLSETILTHDEYSHLSSLAEQYLANTLKT